MQTSKMDVDYLPKLPFDLKEKQKILFQCILCSLFFSQSAAVEEPVDVSGSWS